MPELIRFVSRVTAVTLPDVYGWVTKTRFDIDTPASDVDVLAALIKTKEFEGPGYDRDKPSAEDKRRITEIADSTIKNLLDQGGKVRIGPGHGRATLRDLYRRTGTRPAGLGRAGVASLPPRPRPGRRPRGRPAPPGSGATRLRVYLAAAACRSG